MARYLVSEGAAINPQAAESGCNFQQRWKGFRLVAMIKALIFDLDNCLASSREVGEALFEPAFEAIRHANHGTVPEEQLEKAFDDCWGNALDWVAEKYGFSNSMLAAGWKIFAKMEVTRPMSGYGDLAFLTEFQQHKLLVTSGFRRLQQSKIDALGLERYFTDIYIDAIDEPDRFGKEGIFQLILDTHHLKPAEVMVVGDNPASEIEAGSRLGMQTVQTLRPEVERSDSAHHHIHSLGELKELLLGGYS
jgi:FMN phosphatase YigB (HAD superfamily)